MSIFMLLCISSLTVNGLFSNKKSEEARFKGEVFCRNRSHLIRLEKIGEIFLVEASVGTAILLQCKFCDEDDSRKPRLWYRQNHTTGEINEYEFILSGKHPRTKETELHSFVNRNVSVTDIGLYYCKFPYEDSFSSGFNYLIEIVNKTVEPLNGTLLQWKNYSDEYLMPANNELQKQFVVSGTDVKVHFEVFSSWSEWTPCEICKKNPHQFQTAHCRVRAVCLHEICSRALANGTTKGEAGIVRLLLNTSTSLPCRGQLLPHYIPQVADLVQNIPDFRHNQSCQPSCPLSGGPTGYVQRKILNLEEGQSTIIPCPGQQGKTKVRWEYNKRKLDPKELNTPEGHVLVDHFGTLHLIEITSGIKGTYKCFSHDIPKFEVKIRVHRKSRLFGNGFFRHFRYLLSVILVCLFIFVAMVIVAFCRAKCRRTKVKGGIDMDLEEGREPLLSEERELDEESETSRGDEDENREVLYFERESLKGELEEEFFNESGSFEEQEFNEDFDAEDIGDREVFDEEMNEGQGFEQEDVLGEQLNEGVDAEEVVTGFEETDEGNYVEEYYTYEDEADKMEESDEKDELEQETGEYKTLMK